MTKEELLERYEALGDEADFRAAEALYAQAVREAPHAGLLNDHGYLLFCHARRELGRAAELYERAVELDPGCDKPHYQLIAALEALGDAERAVARYEAALAAAPAELRLRRFLGRALLAAREHARARAVAEEGLALAPDDAGLLAIRGEARAGTRDPEGALADWRCALELDPDDLGPLYSSAFLLEREGRLGEAAEAWRAIVVWAESRGLELEARWPRQELERVSARSRRSACSP